MDAPRERLGEVLAEAHAGGRIIVRQAGEPVAALISPDALAWLEWFEARRVELIRAIEEIQARRDGRPVPCCHQPDNN